MAQAIQMSADALKSIADQIGDRIAEEFSSAPAAEPPAPVEADDRPSDFNPFAVIGDPRTARFRLVETFEVWKLFVGGADELARASEDLVTLTRPTGAYHHQVKVGDGEAAIAVAFAHSYALRLDERVVRDFFFSPLAADIDKAVGLADQLIPGDAVARLLSASEYKVEALWFVTPSAGAAPASPGAAQPRSITTKGLIIVSAPDSFRRALGTQATQLVSSSDFIQALTRAKRGMGLLL